MKRFKNASIELLKDLLFVTVYFLVIAGPMAFGILWYLSPCDGFKEGVLYYGPAPARCME